MTSALLLATNLEYFPNLYKNCVSIVWRYAFPFVLRFPFHDGQQICDDKWIYCSNNAQFKTLSVNHSMEHYYVKLLFDYNQTVVSIKHYSIMTMKECRIYSFGNGMLMVMLLNTLMTVLMLREENNKKKKVCYSVINFTLIINFAERINCLCKCKL